MASFYFVSTGKILSSLFSICKLEIKMPTFGNTVSILGTIFLSSMQTGPQFPGSHPQTQWNTGQWVSLKQESANYSMREISPLLLWIKFYWTTATPIHLCFIGGCLQASRHSWVIGTKTIWLAKPTVLSHLVLQRKSLTTSILETDLLSHLPLHQAGFIGPLNRVCNDILYRRGGQWKK